MRSCSEDWMSAAYEARSSCIADQYSHYVVAGDTHINGKLIPAWIKLVEGEAHKLARLLRLWLLFSSLRLCLYIFR